MIIRSVPLHPQYSCFHQPTNIHKRYLPGKLIIPRVKMELVYYTVIFFPGKMLKEYFNISGD